MSMLVTLFYYFRKYFSCGIEVVILLGLMSNFALSVPLYGLFETSITNNTNYGNKFRDVTLNVTFTSPSGATKTFWGFFDGDGTGGPDNFDADNPIINNAGELSGNIWKLRFMPDELGTWMYTWSFSDGSKNGTGSFDVTDTGARPGVLKPLSSNYHWFQSADGSPFFPKTFYPVHGEQLSYDISIYGPQVYQKAINKGYNTFTLNILPIWDWNTNQTHPDNGIADNNFLLWYQDKPYQGKIDDGTVYDTDRMNLFAYKRLEQHISWLADRGVAVMMFQGFAIKRSLPDYRRPDMFSNDKADWFIRYNMARLAPYWNMIWNYTWEVDPGSKTLEFGQLIDTYDPWDHMYTTQALGDGNFSDNVYDISTIEVSPSTIPNYYQYGKPIHMIEDAGPLWRFDWNQNDADALDKGWKLICQGAFFSWNEWYPSSPPYQIKWDKYFTSPIADYITILYNFIGDETKFASLKPHRELVDNGAYALADPGNQYVVYKSNGGAFNINLANGVYNVMWLDPFNNSRINVGTVNGPGQVSFTTPVAKHYVLFLDGIPSDSSPPTTPQSLNAIPTSKSQIDLTWQASTDPESGISNYNIYRDGVNIGQPATTSFSDTGLNEGATYTYEVSAVNGAGLESTKSTSVSATTIADTTSPTIMSVTADSVSTQIVVVFSEPVEQISAANTANYNIDNTITVSGASLGSDLKTVTLTTSSHSDGVTYTLTVNNVKDLASVPNVIAPNTTKSYTFVPQLVIGNLTVSSGQTYEIVQNGLQEGVLVYIDRTYTYSSTPASVQGATYIKTANGDKGSSGSSFITFDVNKEVNVYVAHDDRITTKPSWMTSFNDTGDDLVTTDTSFSLFSKDYVAGSVTLGGNEGSGNSMYAVIVVGQGTNSTPDTTPPLPPTGLTIQ